MPCNLSSSSCINLLYVSSAKNKTKQSIQELKTTKETTKETIKQNKAQRTNTIFDRGRVQRFWCESTIFFVGSKMFCKLICHVNSMSIFNPKCLVAIQIHQVVRTATLLPRHGLTALHSAWSESQLMVTKNQKNRKKLKKNEKREI